MCHTSRDPQRFASLELFSLKGHRLLPALRVGRGHVHEVTVVAHDPGRCLAPAKSFDPCVPGGDVFVGQRLGFPLSLVLRKDLNALALQGGDRIQGVVHPARDGEVRTKPWAIFRPGYRILGTGLNGSSTCLGHEPIILDLDSGCRRHVPSISRIF